MAEMFDPGNTRPWEVRIYWAMCGFNVRCRVFTGHLGGGTFCGHLIFSVSEWQKVKETMPGAVFIQDQDNGNFFKETGYQI